MKSRRADEQTSRRDKKIISIKIGIRRRRPSFVYSSARLLVCYV